MPKFLEAKLKKEYPNNPQAVFGTMNKLGAMKGNKVTAKGEAMERKHERDVRAPNLARGHSSVKHTAKHQGKLYGS